MFGLSLSLTLSLSLFTLKLFNNAKKVKYDSWSEEWMDRLITQIKNDKKIFYMFHTLKTKSQNDSMHKILIDFFWFCFSEGDVVGDIGFSYICAN